MDPQAAKNSIPNDNLAFIDHDDSIKSLPQEVLQHKKAIVITQCLCDPCPKYYTDVISESILICCNDMKHTSYARHTSNNEEVVKD